MFWFFLLGGRRIRAGARAFSEDPPESEDLDESEDPESPGFPFSRFTLLLYQSRKAGSFKDETAPAEEAFGFAFLHFGQDFTGSSFID